MTRRVAIISDASNYVGPDLCRVLAARDHDLVVGSPSQDLVDELRASGSEVVAVSDVRDLADPVSSTRLVEAAIERFGRFDAAVAFTGRIVVGRFLRS
jgi:NAD(P)-dependent dehydrogenase (short-subunit alcohol dehydrogenase family)